MSEDLILFIEKYQEMRSMQQRYLKHRDKLSYIRTMQLQIELDERAPALLATLNMPGVYLTVIDSYKPKL